MASARVQIFTSRFCGYCTAARMLLTTLRVPYDEVDLSHDKAARAQVSARTGRSTVPFVFIDGTFIGGFAELRALSKRGGLDALRQTG